MVPKYQINSTVHETSVYRLKASFWKKCTEKWCIFNYVQDEDSRNTKYILLSCIMMTITKRKISPTIAMHLDLILSIQNPFSTSRPVLCSSSLSWLMVNGRTKCMTNTTLETGFLAAGMAGLLLGTGPSYMWILRAGPENLEMVLQDKGIYINADYWA